MVDVRQTVGNPELPNGRIGEVRPNCLGFSASSFTS